MNLKKVLPVIFFVLLAIAAIALKRCNDKPASSRSSNTTANTRGSANRSNEGSAKFNRNTSELFFTKHARCRMACRKITQQEVREILANGTINYSKSELNDPQGATYALEGLTSDRQHVRIIFAPKQKHLSVVTVIDLENEYQCDCD